MATTISGQVSAADYLYQGTTDDPPVPLHFEGRATTTEAKKNPWNTVFKSKLFQAGNHLKKLRLEMVAFLFTFSYTMTRISSTTMIIDKVCLAHFEYPEEICRNLQNFTRIKSSVERVATNYQLGHTLIQTAPAALLACFIGPWSDHYGRKFPTLLALSGMIIDTLGSTVCAYYLNSRVEYYYIPALFTGMFGGIVSLLAVVYSYASDMTAFEKRTMKYAFIEMAAGFAIPFGATAGGWIYKFFGYPAVFFLSFGGLCLSFIWVSFLLPETRGMDSDDPWSVKIEKLFSCKSFKQSFIATAKKRPNHGRRQIVLLILSMCFLVITINSTGDINYLYVHHQFNWGNTTYSTITAIYSIFAIVLLLIVIPLLKYFKTGDPTLGLVGTISLLGKNIGVGLAYKPAIYHIASLFGLLGGCSTLAARSRISKVVSNDDLGKVFSFVATAESLLPILTTVLTSQIFNAFLNTFAGMPYIFLAFFLMLPLSVFIWMACMPTVNYEDIDHSPVKSEDLQTSV